MSAGLGRPWSSWDDAVFWLWMLSLAAGWALAVVAVAGVRQAVGTRTARRNFPATRITAAAAASLA